MKRAPVDTAAVIPAPLLAVLAAACLAAGCQDAAVAPPEPGPVWVTFAAPWQPLPSNRVNDIVCHRNGQVWIATDSGAAFFSRGNWGVFVDSLSYTVRAGTAVIRSARVTSVAYGKDGSLWFGTAGGGLRRYFEGGTGVDGPWLTYRQPEIGSDFITDISCELIVNGDVWAGTLTAGLERFAPSAADPRYGSWTHYTAAVVPEFGSNQVRAVNVNFNNQTVWVSTLFKLLALMNGVDDWRTIDVPAYTSGVHAVAFDVAGNRWIGRNDGVSKYDAYSAWTLYTNANTGGRLPAGTVRTITTDFNSVRWFGTDNGLARLADTAWTRFNRDSATGLPSDSITALAYDGFGNLWIGTTAGIAVYNPKGTTF